MKRHFLLIMIIVLFFFIFPPLISFGATKSVTLTWTISDPSGIQGYKLYYSYNENMVDKIWNQNCGPTTEQSPGTFSMTCNTVQIDNYPVYFTIAAITQNEEIESTPQIVTADSGTNISKVKDFEIVNTGQTTF